MQKSAGNSTVKSPYRPPKCPLFAVSVDVHDVLGAVVSLVHDVLRPVVLVVHVVLVVLEELFSLLQRFGEVICLASGRPGTHTVG